MDLLLHLVVWVVTPCALAATIKYSLTGWVKFPENPILKIVSNEKWLFSLLLFVPWLVGDFARGETSPLPWITFKEYSRHGASSGALIAIIVVIVDLWLFWVPAQIYNEQHSQEPVEQRRLVRAVNFLVGLLLTTAGNPIYRFLIYLFSF